MLKEISELGTRRKALVYFPEDPFVFVSQPFVVGVLQTGPPEGTQLHSHDEVGCRCGENVCLDTIVDFDRVL